MDEPEEELDNHTRLDHIVLGIRGTKNYIEFLGDPLLIPKMIERYDLKKIHPVKKRRLNRLPETAQPYDKKIGIIDIDKGYRYEKF